MTRKRLESALVAGALIDPNFSPCFRFTRVRFVKHCFPPGYDRPNVRDVYEDNDGDHEDATQHATPKTNSLDTCTCGGIPFMEEKITTEDTVTAMLGEGDCEPIPSMGTQPCRVHMKNYLKRHPWRRLQDDYSVHSVQFNNIGTQLLAGSANTSIRVIQTTDGRQRQLPRPSKWTLGMPVTSIRFMPPAMNWACACNSHGEVFAFQPEEEGFETLFKEPQQTYTLDFSPDGSELATGGVDKKIRIYTLRPGTVVGMPQELTERRAKDQIAREGRSSIISNHSSKKPEGAQDSTFNIPFGGRPDQIVHWTANQYDFSRCFSLPQPCPHSPEPKAYHRSDAPPKDPLLREYVPTSPGINITEGHSMRIMAVRYHPSKPNMLFSAGWDNQVKIWDTRVDTGPVWNIYGPHVASSDGMDLDDNYLATASWRAKSSVEIWDLRNLNTSTGVRRLSQPTTPASDSHEGPAELIPFSGKVWQRRDNGEYPYAVQLLPNRALVAAGSGFHEVRVVGRDTLLPIAQVPTDSVVQTLDSVLEGRYIAAGCASGTVTIIALA